VADPHEGREFRGGLILGGDEYGRIKRLAASVHANDRIAYTDAKGPWIERALADAVQWARATGWRP